MVNFFFPISLAFSEYFAVVIVSLISFIFIVTKEYLGEEIFDEKIHPELYVNNKKESNTKLLLCLASIINGIVTLCLWTTGFLFLSYGIDLKVTTQVFYWIVSISLFLSFFWLYYKNTGKIFDDYHKIKKIDDSELNSELKELELEINKEISENVYFLEFYDYLATENKCYYTSIYIDKKIDNFLSKNKKSSIIEYKASLIENEKRKTRLINH